LELIRFACIFIAREGKVCRRVFDHNQLPVGIQGLREIPLALQGCGHGISQNRWRGVSGKAGGQQTLGDFRVPKEEQLAPVGVELARNINRSTNRGARRR